MSTLRDAGLALKGRIPMSRRRQLALSRVQVRSKTARFRGLPDFLVIGAQRSGTSSLYKYLGEHPNVVASLRKEIEYFSTDFAKGEDWYRAHFPLTSRLWAMRKLSGVSPVCFEATPDYLLDPRAAPRAKAMLPDAKIVVLLRDPVERAHSHYHHNLRYRLEDLSFDEALAAEDDRLEHEYDKIDADPSYKALPLRRYSYVTRGLYADQLQPWLDAYGTSVAVIPSAGLFGDTSGRLADLCEFLDVPPNPQSEYRNYSYTSQPTVKTEMSASTRQWLRDRFTEPNRELFTLLGQDYGWNDRLTSEQGS